MTPQSAKAKGRLGQQEVAARIVEQKTFDLESGDVQSRPMGSQGEDLMMSPKAMKALYFDDWEIKRRSRISIVRWFDQVIKRKAKKPIVCFREDRGEWFCLVKLDDILNLIHQKGESS